MVRQRNKFWFLQRGQRSSDFQPAITSYDYVTTFVLHVSLIASRPLISRFVTLIPHMLLLLCYVLGNGLSTDIYSLFQDAPVGEAGDVPAAKFQGRLLFPAL